MVTKVRTIDFLPDIFRTQTNEQFLSATLDQLTQQPDFKRIQGFIGSKFGYGINANDKYLVEPTKVRSDYQLEPSVIFKKKDSSTPVDALTYPGLIDSIKLNQGLVEDHTKLFSNDFYSWDSFVDLDKMINYSQYYWLPGGPDPVTITTPTQYQSLDYAVNENDFGYTFTSTVDLPTQYNSDLVLIRGGTYTFECNQDSTFNIQTQPGTSGNDLARPNISTREIYGVTNNSISKGTITFQVPLASAQDQWNYTGNSTVDLVTPLSFNQINGQYVSQLKGIDSVTDLNNKTLMFYGTSPTAVGLISKLYGDGFDSPDPSLNSAITTTLTATNGTTNIITCGSTSQFSVNSAIVITGKPFGGLTSGGTIVVTNTTTGSNKITTYAPCYMEQNQQISFLNDFGGTSSEPTPGVFVYSGINKGVPYYVKTVHSVGTSLTGTKTSGSNSIVMPNTTGLVVGQSVIGAGIPAGSVITNIVANTLILIDQNATTSGTITLTFGAVFTLSDTPGGSDHSLTTNYELSEGSFYGGVYYIKSINSASTFTVSYEPGGSVADLITSTGSMIGSINLGLFEDSINSEINKHFYKITLLGSETTGYYINLTEFGLIPNDTKITSKYGTTYIGRNFVKNSIGSINLIPIITAPLETLYYQDGTFADKFGRIRIIDSPSKDYLDITEILGKKTYTSPNNITFTNGLKVTFKGNVFPNNYLEGEYYVEGVGHAIELLPVSDFELSANFGSTISTTFDSVEYDLNNYEETLSYPVTKDYITLARNSLNKNSWSRSNRWFHIDVLNLVIANNITYPVVSSILADPDSRAKRPILEFYPNLRMYQSGTSAKPSVDFINETATNAFTQVAGQPSFYPDGNSILLYDGATIIFAGDTDLQVRNKIWVVDFVSVTGSSTPVISLSEAQNGEVLYNDQTIIKQGATYKGKVVYFDGLRWIFGQQKERVNQPPLFDIFDSNGISLSDIDFYPGTDFEGCTLLEYAIGTGADDPILGFPIKYSSLNNLGDIAFNVSLNSQTFNYVQNSNSNTEAVNIGYVYDYTSRTDFTRAIGWRTAIGESFQYQVFNKIYTGVPTEQTFVCDVQIKNQTTTPWPVIVVYADNVRLTSSEYTVTSTSSSTTVTILKILDIGQQIDILLYSDQISKEGYYQIPSNLDHNPLNSQIQNINLGDIRGQYKSICNNNPNFVGAAFGPNNYRDLGDVVPYGTRIIQNSAPIVLSGAFYRNNDKNFFNSLQYNSKEYVNFKSLIIDTATNTDFEYIIGTANILDDILDKISANRLDTNAFFYSDMIPSKNAYITNTYTFKNAIDTTIFFLNRVYDFSSANYYGVLVYLTRRVGNTFTTTQLIKDVDYIISSVQNVLNITKDLVTNDVIVIKEYNQTYGSFVPNTPTKLGFYPSFIPGVVYDDTYINPTYFIQGHDGSYNRLYGTYVNGELTDLRDRILLEFEQRIYNNIKVSAKIPIEYDEVVPGQFRNIGISFEEFNLVYTPQFLNWIGTNRVDYQEQDYSSTNPFTYNYKSSSYKNNNKKVYQGNWRGLYLWMYDTTDPANKPWEMLGLTNKPNWWDTHYGSAPYTSENILMWTDISNGYVYNDGDSYIKTNRIRPDLLNILPVDSNGDLLPPLESMIGSYFSEYFKTNWVAGDVGPTEYSYRKSSSWPFDLMRLMALTKPAKFFGLGIDLDLYKYSTEFDQYLVNNRYRLVLTDVPVYGTNTSTASHSYLNWIVDYLCQYGIVGSTQITDLIASLDVRLAYRLAGFSDKDLLNFYVEKGSPSSGNNSLLIPDDSYSVLLYNNEPIDTIIYSSVIIQKTSTGYRVYGNSQTNCYFTYNVPITNSIYEKIVVNGVNVDLPTKYYSYTNSIPYGTEFADINTLSTFLRGYGIYLSGKGLNFNDIENGIELSWTQMISEVAYWVQTGWEVGSTVNVNPSARIINFNNDSSIIQPLTIKNENFVLNQNLLPIALSDLSIVRSGTEFNVKSLNQGDSLSFFRGDVSTIEHIIVFDNETIFNDVLYNLTTGLRQQRFYVKGSKTAEWNGTMNAAGYIMNLNNIEEWQKNIKYSKGTIVKYKNKYYSANKVVILPTITFDYNDWDNTSYESIQKGLLPNPSTRAYESLYFYDSTKANFENDSSLLSFSLIGYRPRTYFADANLDDATQVNLYKNMISVKGTVDSITRLQGINLQENTLNYNIHENWAIKTSEFGGLLNQNYVEFTLNESELTGNPSIVSIIENIGVADAQQEIPLYNIRNYGRSVGSSNILPTMAITIEEKLPSAGYVNIDDVIELGYTFNDLADDAISAIYKNDYLWVANKDNAWQVYTPVSTNALVISVSNNLNNTVTVTFDKPHRLLKSQGMGIINFDTRVDGYYIINDIVSITSLIVSLTLERNVTTINGSGLSYLLQSQRVITARDIDSLPLLNSDYTQNKVWVDQNVNGDWTVYEKTNNYSYDYIQKFTTNIKFGNAVAYVPDFGYFVGDTASGTVYHFGYTEEGYYLRNTFSYPGTEYGKVITRAGNLLFVTSPSVVAPYFNQIYVYRVPPSSNINSITLQQVITIVGDGTSRAGDSLAVSGDGNYLYIGADTDNSVLTFVRDRVSSYSSSGTTLAVATISNPPSEYFIVSGNQLSTILEGQRVSFLTSYTNLSMTVSNTVIDDENYFVVGGDQRTKVSYGDKVAFNNTGPVSSRLYTISVKGYDAGTDTTTFFILETFEPGVNIPLGSPVYRIEFSENSLHTVVAGTYDGTLNQTKFYVIEPIEYTAPSGSYVYFASDNYTYAGTLTPTVIEAGAKYGYSLATNYDGSKLFVGAPYTNYSESLPDTGVVYVYDRIVTTVEAQYDQNIYQNYIIILPITPTIPGRENQARIYKNGVLLPANTYIIVANLVIIGNVGIYAGDLITINMNYWVATSQLFSQDNLSDLRQGELFGYALDTNKYGSEVIVGCPFDISNDSAKEGSAIRFTNAGKRYGRLNAVIGCNLTEPTYILLNGFQVNAFNTVPITVAVTAGVGSTVTISPSTAAQMPSYGVVALKNNLTGLTEDIAYTAVNSTTGVVTLNLTHITMTNIVGDVDYVYVVYADLGESPFTLNQQIVISGVSPSGYNGVYTVLLTTSTITVVANANSETGAVSVLGQISDGPLYSYAVGVGYLVIPLGSAANLANAINLTNIDNIRAYATEDNRLQIRLLKMELGQINNKLNISVFNGNYLYEMGFIDYVKSQVIQDPHVQTRTQFGYAIKFNEENSFVVGAPASIRYLNTVFDLKDDTDNHNDTVFDNNLTTFEEKYVGAGSVYMYDYIQSYDESMTNIGKYIYAQNCNDHINNYGSNPMYGASLAFNDNIVMVGSPQFNVDSAGGRVVVYTNTSGVSDWHIYRESDPVVDIEKIQKVQLYDNVTNETLESLDYIDPLNGKLLGIVRENLDFISTSDPAGYNSSGLNVGKNVWAHSNLGKMWFNTTTTRFINYHQNDVEYNSKWWGRAFPGSDVTVYTWIESDTIPALYIGPGTPYDFAKYSIVLTTDNNNNIVSKYYYWVRNTNTVYAHQGKTLSDSILEQYISDPQNSGIAYFAPLRPNTYGLYNAQEYINDTSTNMHLGFSTGLNDTSGHNEFQLIRADYPDDFLTGFPDTNKGYNTPVALYDRLLDSLSGTDEQGQPVPDFTLPKLVQLGVGIRPRQSFFNNRFEALRNYLEYVNGIVKQYPIMESGNTTFLLAQGSYFNTTNYWDYIYWWDVGYSDATRTLLEVPIYSDLLTLTATQGMIVGVVSNSNGNREVYRYDANTWVRIGVQNGTIAFLETLWDYTVGKNGFGDSFYDNASFDQYPSIETRYIIRAINEQIFIGSLLEFRNKALILLFEYIQSENIESQNYLPWLTKTSFADVNYTVRELTTNQKFQRDNQNLLQGYVNEVKPYHVVLKDFYLKYTRTDSYLGDLTDFDLPGKYNDQIGKFVSPQLAYQLDATDTTYEFTAENLIWYNVDYINWIQNYGTTFGEIPNTIISVVAIYISASDNVIYVDNANGFPVNGEIIIDGETIKYTNVDRSLRKLIGVSRGVNNTIPVGHFAGTSIFINLPAVVVLDTGRDYTYAPTVTAVIDTTIYPAPNRNAVLEPIMSGDKVIGINVVDPGEGYVVEPNIVFEPSFTVSTDYNRINFIDNTMQIVSTNFSRGELVYFEGTSSNEYTVIPNGYYYINIIEVEATLLLAVNATIISLHYTYRDSIFGLNKVQFLDSSLITEDYIQSLSIVPRAIPTMVNRNIRSIKPTLKFDRTGYRATIQPWLPNQYYSSPYISIGNDTSSPATLYISQPYYDLSGTVVPSGGTGATFTVYNVLLGQDYVVDVALIGINYNVNDVITIPGTQLNGASPVNDCLITVESVGASGEISTISVTGTAVDASLASLQGAVLPITALSSSESDGAVVTVNYNYSGLQPGQVNGAYMYFYRTHSSYTYNDTGKNFTATISGTVMDVTAIDVGDVLAVGDSVYGSIPNGASISSFGTGSGGLGTYNLTGYSTFVGTGSITGTTLDITIITAGTLAVGDTISGGTILPNTIVTEILDDSSLPYSYTVNILQTVLSTSITATKGPLSLNTNGGAIINIFRPRFNPASLSNLYYMQIVDFGHIYSDGQNINILGSNFGGVDGINDAKINIQYANVDGQGSIFFAIITGIAVGEFARYYVKPISSTELEIYSDSTLVVPVPYSTFIWNGGSGNDYGYLPEPVTANYAYGYNLSSIVYYAGYIWQCINANNDSEFTPSNWQLLSSSDSVLNALDRIEAYYAPKLSMPGIDAQQLVKGITYPNNVYYGNSFAPEDVLPLDFELRDKPFYPRDINVKSIIYNGSTAVAIAEGTDISIVLHYDSAVGVWESVTVADISLGMTHIAYLNDVYVITSTNKNTPIYISYDGLDWTTIGEVRGYDYQVDYDDGGYNLSPISAPRISLNSTIIVNDIIYAVGEKIIRSVDGITFNIVYVSPSRLTSYLNDIVYADITNFTGYVAVGFGSSILNGAGTSFPTISSVNIIVTSSDGVNWKLLQPNLTTYAFNSVTASDTTLVTVGDNSTVYYSTNAGNWSQGIITAYSGTTALNSVTYGDSLFVAVGDKIGAGDSDPGLIIISSDGITWTDISSQYITVQNLNQVYYSSGEFYIVGENDTILRSFNGTTWVDIANIRESADYYVVQGNDFLFGYGPEELVAGVVYDNLSMYVNTSPGAYWDIDNQGTFWYKYTGFNMKASASKPTLDNTVSFKDKVVNPARISVFIMNDDTKQSYRIYEDTTTTNSPYTYTTNWHQQYITLNQSLVSGTSVIIEVYEVGNSAELARGNSKYIPLKIDEYSGNSKFVINTEYQNLPNDPLVYASVGGGPLEKLIYGVDYFSTNSTDNLLELMFTTVYDPTVDYVVFTVPGKSTDITSTSSEYGYSIPETQVYVPSGTISSIPYDTDLVTVTGDNIDNSIVEINGIRLIPVTDYTIDTVGGTVDLVSSINSDDIFAITTYYDTSRQFLVTQEYSGFTVAPIKFVDISRTPIRITFTSDPGYSSSDLVKINKVSGSTELNGNTYYVKSITIVGDSNYYYDLYSDSALSYAIAGPNFSNYINGGYMWLDSDTITVPNPTVPSPMPAMTYDNGARTWVTINGLRVDPEQMIFHENNVLDICSDMTSLDTILVTAMVSGESPNPIAFNVNVNKYSEGYIYRTNPEDGSWLTQDFYDYEDTMHFFNVNNLIDTITVTRPVSLEDTMLYTYVQCDITQVKEVSVYNINTLTTLDKSLFSLSLLNHKSALIFQSGVNDGDNLIITLIIGNIVEISGERIRFDSINTIDNTVSGLTRGVQGTRSKDVHYIYEIGYGINNTRRLTDLEYRSTWNSTDISPLGDPLQISTTPSALFLQSNQINER